MYFSYSKENLRKIKLIKKLHPLSLKVFPFDFCGYICRFYDHIEQFYQTMSRLVPRSTSRWLITSRDKVSINKGGVFKINRMRRYHIAEK